MISFKTVKITAVLPQKPAGVVIKTLEQYGFYDIYLQEGRHPVLGKGNNIANFFTGKQSLFSALVKIINIYVPAKFEDDVLTIIAEKGRLYSPGQGSVYSEPCHQYGEFISIDKSITRFSPTRSFVFGDDLVGISCIVQRGEADPLARAILQAGLGSPNIHFGTGTGLREKIGLLRITIPAAKEILTVVVSRWDQSRVIDMLIAVGRLHLPGRGFIRGCCQFKFCLKNVGKLKSLF